MTRSKRRAAKQSTDRSLPSSRRRWTSIILLSTALAVVILGIASWQIFQSGVEDPGRLRAAEIALGQQRYEIAEQIALQVESDSPSWADSRLLASEAASLAGKPEAAAFHLEILAQGNDDRSLNAALMLGEIRRGQGRLSLAEPQYRHVLRYRPDDTAARQRLVFLLDLTGRRWEAVPHYLRLIRAGQFTFEQLTLLADPSRGVSQPQYIAECLRQAPDDLLARTAAALEQLAEGDQNRALAELREIIADRPDLIAAQAAVGRILLGQDQAAFDRWLESLPSESNQDPDIWLVRAEASIKDGQLENAVLGLRQSLTLAPEHRLACYQLGQVLQSLQHPDAQVALDRGLQLVELRTLVDDAIAARGRHEPSMTRIVDSLEAMGRLWEAWAWGTVATQSVPNPQPFAAKVAALSKQLDPKMPLTVDTQNLAKIIDFDAAVRLAQASTGDGKSADGSTAGVNQTDASGIRFELASGVGIDFVYNNGEDLQTPGARMIEETGGGVGVIDFDSDGWPDLYLTQGGSWPTGADRPSPSPEYRDHFYRNLAGGSFAEIALPAGIDEQGFSQGIAVGDLNSDGFADLYVANIGRNRLYRNNGDGTFTDISTLLDASSKAWTTSCVIADFDGDGNPDLYEANYLQGEGVFTLICAGKACSPNVFDGAPNQFHLNRGNGKFEAATDSTAGRGSKSLGLVAARLGDDDQLSIFVANDQVPNFLLRPSASNAGDPPAAANEVADPQLGGVSHLVDQAMRSGVALNGDGLATAAMGIATEDLDANGQVDFLVSNFLGEPNALYMQDDLGNFNDASRAAGLHQPSVPYVGWGTQFIDANLDGQSDVVVTNGHVDDNRDVGEPYRMPTQFLINRGRLRFELVVAGDYFSQEHLGRGLAKLDWNGDGRFDFVVSNMNEPAALVTNKSTDVGHFLNLHLHGTASSRDSIGAIVDVQCQSGQWSKQLVAGDGYQASNERLLQFGLGQCDSDVLVIVRWPSGGKSEFRIETDQTVHVVESQPRAITAAGQILPVEVASNTVQE
jgi:tetratricopeptide (TPR) repeat protein